MAIAAAFSEQDAWVKRVLGLTVPRGGSAPPDEATLRTAVGRMAMEVRKAIAGATGSQAASLAEELRQLEALVGSGDLAAANDRLGKLAATIDATATTKAVQPTPRDEAMKQWRQARTSAAAPLQDLLEKVGEATHPGSAGASMLIDNIIRHISVDPETRRDAEELEQWLSSDDIVGKIERPNGFGIAVQVREPLSRALRDLASMLEG